MPQYNPDTEAALIGACLKSAKAFDAAREIIKDDGDFYYVHNQNAWKAMQDIAGRGLGVDVVTVGDELERGGKLAEFTNSNKQFSGRAALQYCRENSEARNVTAYAAEVVDYSAKRQLELICTQAVNWSQNGRRASEIMLDLTKRMGDVKIFDALVKKHTQTLAEAVSLAYDHTDAANSGKIVTLSTGFTDIDFMLGGGLMAPDLWVIAGRPGDGKTALMVSIAKAVAELGKRVVIFTLEMQNKQIAMRLIAMESGITYQKQKSGKLAERDWPLYTNAVDKLSDPDYGIILNDLPSIKTSTMRSELRRIWADKPCDLIVVDYIQLQGSDNEHERRDLQIGEITSGLKTIAKEFDCPIIAGAQMSREVEKRTDRKPQLSDLRESGSIENDADIVSFLHRPDKENKAATELIYAKNRNGAVGAVDLYFHEELTKFTSATTKTYNLKG